MPNEGGGVDWTKVHKQLQPVTGVATPGQAGSGNGLPVTQPASYQDTDVQNANLGSSSIQKPTAAINSSLNDYIDMLTNSRQEYNPLEYPGHPYSPGSTAAERAAALVNNKYSGQESQLHRSAQKNDQDLAVGTATQNNYAVAGDAKLADIYGKLTSFSQGIADQTKGLYAGAQQQVGQQYADAQSALHGAVSTAASDVATQAAQLGLSAATQGEATQNMSEQAKALESQQAADKANSLANITMLGANMGAAALKDVTNIATMGANTRRDLVMTVQNTLAQLQYKHDQVSADLQSQLQDLQSQRANDLQSVTSQIEANDYDRQYKYESEKATFDANQQQIKLQEYKANLSDMAAVLKVQEEAAAQRDAHALAVGAQQIQRDTLTSNQQNQREQRRIDWAAQGLTQQQIDQKEREFTFTSQDKTADNVRADKIASENARHTAEVERITAAHYDTQAQHDAAVLAENHRHSTAAEATAAANSSTAQENANTNAAKEAAATNPSVLAAKAAKAAADLKRVQADTALTNARKQALVDKKSGNSTKGLKDESGMQAYVESNKIDPNLASAIKSYETDYNSMPAADAIQYSLAHPKASAYDYVKEQIKASGASAAAKSKALILAQIYFGKG